MQIDEVLSSYDSCIIARQVQKTGHRSQVTGLRSQVTGHRSQKIQLLEDYTLLGVPYQLLIPIICIKLFHFRLHDIAMLKCGCAEHFQFSCKSRATTLHKHFENFC